MPWTPVDDTQGGSWTGVGSGPAVVWTSAGGSNTPGWSAIVSAVGGAFQFGAFQPAFQMGTGSAWSPVDDSETSVWVPLP
jgi:hypothetical protein